MKLPIIIAIVCVFFSCSAISRSSLYNTTQNVIDKNNWHYFFYPKIRVLASGGCKFFGASDKTLNAGECKYVCPQNVRVYKTTCSFFDVGVHLPGFEDFTVLIQDKKGTHNCVCASKVTSCSNSGLNKADIAGWFNGVIDCYLLPLGPPPQPFCDGVGKQIPVVKIVPIKDATFLNPKIKVMVGMDISRKCTDGTTVDIVNNCAAPSSTQEILSYTSKAELKPGESTTLSYNGKSYKFSAKLGDDNEICADYTSDSLSSLNESQCYQLSEMPKPVIHSIGNKKARVTVEGYNNNRAFDILEGQSNSTTGLSLIRPKRDKDGVIMRDSKKNDIIEDHNAALCVHIKNPLNDYIFIDSNKKKIRLKKIGKVFAETEYNSLLNARVLSEKSYAIRMNIQDTDQNLLDTVKIDYDGSIRLRPNMGQEKYFQYTTPNLPTGSGELAEYVKYDHTQSPVSIPENQVKNLRNISDYSMEMCHASCSGSSVQMKKTQGVDILKGQSKYYCMPNGCSSIEIEAWGAGSKGSSNCSGASGSYVKADLPMFQAGVKRLLRVDRNNADITVAMCDMNEGNCEQLLIARGASGATPQNGEIVSKKLLDTKISAGGSPICDGSGNVSVPQVIVDTNDSALVTGSVTNNALKYTNDICNNHNIAGMGSCPLPGALEGDGFVKLICKEW